MASYYVPPAGMRPLGFFDGVRRYELPRPPVIRADDIDPLTGDFRRLLADIDPIDAQVVNSLWLVRSSGAAIEDVGSRFLDIDCIDDRAKIRIENEARNALSALISRGDITVDKITVLVGTENPVQGAVADWAELTVEYFNHRSAIDKQRTRSVTRRIPEAVRS